MSLRTRRAVRLLVAVAFTWVGVALFAHAALAWEAKIQVAKVNAGGAANDAFVFQPTITSTSGSAITAPFSLKGGELPAVRRPLQRGERLLQRPDPKGDRAADARLHAEGRQLSQHARHQRQLRRSSRPELAAEARERGLDRPGDRDRRPQGPLPRVGPVHVHQRPGRCAAAAGAHRGAIRAGAGAGAADPGLARAVRPGSAKLRGRRRA